MEVHVLHINKGHFNETHFADGEAEDLFKISWLTNEQEVKGPTTAEVCHDNGVDWHRREELTPRSFEFLLRNIERIHVSANLFIPKHMVLKELYYLF